MISKVLVSSSTTGSRLFTPPKALFKSVHIDWIKETNAKSPLSSKLLSIAF